MIHVPMGGHFTEKQVLELIAESQTMVFNEIVKALIDREKIIESLIHTTKSFSTESGYIARLVECREIREGIQSSGIDHIEKHKAELEK